VSGNAIPHMFDISSSHEFILSTFVTPSTTAITRKRNTNTLDILDPINSLKKV
jgi:hypothetical protein